MLQEAAKLAIETAISVTQVSAVCTTVGDEVKEIPSRTIEFAKAGFGGLSQASESVNAQMVRILDSDKSSLIVWKEDLVINNQFLEPTKGDRFEITLSSGETMVAHCATPPGGDRHWRFTDRFQTAVRIFLEVVVE